MNVAVIGGGITGLTAAWQLSKAGHTVRLFEAGSRLGGSIRTDIDGDWLVEAGPNSIMVASAGLAAGISELGLDSEQIAASPLAKYRFIVSKGKLEGFSLSPATLLKPPAISLGAMVPFLRDLARRPIKRTQDLSVADFIRSHWGREILDKVFQPIVSGIHAGDPERLSARLAFPSLWKAEAAKGSLVRGLLAVNRQGTAGQAASPTLISFRKGLQALPDAMAARLAKGAVALDSEIQRVEPGRGARWRLSGAGPGGAIDAECDAVVIAIPAAALASLEVGSRGDTPLSGLSEIEHPPVVSLFLGYRREQLRHRLNGFGGLVPAIEKRSILGVVFNSSLFPGRAPEGHVALTVLAGGVLQPDIARLPAEQFLALAERDLADLLGVTGRPVFMRRAFWPRAIPQYNLGYERHLEAMATCERSNPGLYIGGNARDGISLTNCIKSGSALAKRVS